MGRIMSFGQDGRMVRDFDKSEHDFMRRYGKTPEEVMVENAKLRELLHDFLYEHADYIADGNYFIGDLDLEHAMHHNQAYFRREAKKLGIEVDE